MENVDDDIAGGIYGDSGVCVGACFCFTQFSAGIKKSAHIYTREVNVRVRREINMRTRRARVRVKVWVESLISDRLLDAARVHRAYFVAQVSIQASVQVPQKSTKRSTGVVILIGRNMRAFSHPVRAHSINRRTHGKSLINMQHVPVSVGARTSILSTTNGQTICLRDVARQPLLEKASVACKGV